MSGPSQEELFRRQVEALEKLNSQLDWLLDALDRASRPNSAFKLDEPDE